MVLSAFFGGNSSTALLREQYCFTTSKHSTQHSPSMLREVRLWYKVSRACGVRSPCMAHSATPKGPRMHRTEGGRQAGVGRHGAGQLPLDHSSEPTPQTAPRGASYAAHARAPSLADQRRAGPGGHGGGHGMDGIYLIAHQMNFSSIFGSESYRCDARHQVDERNETISQSRTRSVRVFWLDNIAIEGQPKRSTQSASARACHRALRILGALRQRVRKKLGGFGWRFLFSYYY